MYWFEASNVRGFLRRDETSTFRLTETHPVRKKQTNLSKASEKTLFGGSRYTFCRSTLFWTDVYGIIIHIDFDLHGKVHDKSM